MQSQNTFEKTYLDISDAKGYCEPVTQEKNMSRKILNSYSISVLITLSRQYKAEYTSVLI